MWFLLGFLLGRELARTEDDEELSFVPFSLDCKDLLAFGMFGLVVIISAAVPMWTIFHEEPLAALLGVDLANPRSGSILQDFRMATLIGGFGLSLAHLFGWAMFGQKIVAMTAIGTAIGIIGMLLVGPLGSGTWLSLSIVGTTLLALSAIYHRITRE